MKIKFKTISNKKILRENITKKNFKIKEHTAIKTKIIIWICIRMELKIYKIKVKSNSCQYMIKPKFMQILILWWAQTKSLTHILKINHFLKIKISYRISIIKNPFKLKLINNSNLYLHKFTSSNNLFLIIHKLSLKLINFLSYSNFL